MDTLQTIRPATAGVVRLVQITDTHIFAGDDEHFKGFDTTASLAAVITAIQRLQPAPDCILATGDLVHDPVPAAYRRLSAQLRTLPVPVCCLPGNHDDPALLQAELNCDQLSTPKIIECGAWRILMLDTHLPGSQGGRLGAGELEFLETELNGGAQAHRLIVMHHHPVPIQSAWMDGMMLENAADFWSIAGNCHSLRGVLWGHIHQDYQETRKGLELFGTPSTCTQFRPATEEPEMDCLPPAFRSLELYPDGVVVSKLHWVESTPG